MEASVRNISPVNNIFGIGTIPPDKECVVPAGSTTRQLKHCELCGVLFTRETKSTEVRAYYENRLHTLIGDSYKKAELRRDTGERLCRNCHNHYTLEDRVRDLAARQEGNKHRLPNMDSIHASSRPIRYPKPKLSRAEILLQSERSRQAIRKAFAEKGKLSSEDLRALLFNCPTLPGVHWRIKTLGFNLRRVGSLPRKGIGRAVAVYILPTVQ